MMTATQNESLRRATLMVLAIRFPVPLPLRAVVRRIETEGLIDGKFTDEDLTAALEFLRSEGLVQFVVDPMGSSKSWSATSAGVKAYERS